MQSALQRPVPPPDLFLASLFARDGFFDLGGKISPGSIRDQIVRASLFSELAQAHGYVSGRRDKVLIIGAGAAGLTVALRMASIQGVKVVLADRNKEPLSLQGDNDQRFISPSLYDWPSTHFSFEEFAGKCLPEYHEGTPADFAEGWRREFNNALRSSGGSLRFFGQTSVDVDESGEGPPWRIGFSSAGQTWTDEFHLVVACRGFGRERCPDVLDTRGNKTGAELPIFGFWEPDPYPPPAGTLREVPPGGPWEQEYCTVAILGGGDGAIQDMIRFVSGGRSTREVLKALDGTLPINLPMLDHLCQIQLDDKARSGDVYEHHRSCQIFVSELFRDPERSSDLEKQLGDIIKFDSVQMFYKDAVLGPCYSLNRFVALLFNRYVRRKKGRTILRPLHTLHGVECVHHNAKPGYPDECIGEDKTHRVWTTLPDGSHRRVSCRIVIPRIGTDWDHVRTDRVQAVVKHALPYWTSDWGPGKRTFTARKIRPWPARAMVLRCLWWSLPPIAVIKDREGKLMYCNPALLEMLQKTQEELRGSLPVQYWREELGAAITKADTEVRDKGKAVITREWFDVAEGLRQRRYTFRFPMTGAAAGSGSLGFDLQGDRYSATLPADRLSDPPDPAELESFFESLPCSVAVRDPEGRNKYVNGSYAKLIEDITGKQVPVTDVFPDEYLPATGPTYEIRRESWVHDDPRALCTVEKSPDGQSERYVVRFGVFDEAGELIGSGSIGFARSLQIELERINKGRSEADLLHLVIDDRQR
jgi:PAS domain-containing protein